MQTALPTFAHIDKIQQLSSKYQVNHLTPAQKQNGFIRIEYDREGLIQIINHQEIVIAIDNGKVVGYFLIGKTSNIASLDIQKNKAISMFDTHSIPFEKIGYGCQICIDEAYRNQGVSRLMLTKLLEILNHKYTLLLSTISNDNSVSLQNSTAIGWQILNSLETPKFYIYKT